MCWTETLVAAGGHQLKRTSPDDVRSILLLSINNKVQYEAVSEEHVFRFMCGSVTQRTRKEVQYSISF